ncbi:hypothetical protein FKW77_000712 [Venturia effusa]|uniref:J domain-containing protein n=1 Tax=Venturia effusa TaxID=50376 RepID=A0A517LGL1_9PEZI|nr:hypothetical protein FKW77_000712 [Venturia effusa]
MPTTTATDYYKVLSVARDANAAQIKKAYHSLALEHHPDKNAETDGTRFKAILEAYEVLSDPIKKSDYDTSHDLTPAPPKTSRSHWADWDQLYADQWNLHDPRRSPTGPLEHGDWHHRQHRYGSSSSEPSYYPRSRSISPDRVSNCSSNNSETRAASNSPGTRYGGYEQNLYSGGMGSRSQERLFRGNGEPSTTEAAPTPMPAPDPASVPAHRTRAYASEKAPSASQQTPNGREQTQQKHSGFEPDFIAGWEIDDMLEVPPRRSSLERDAEPNLVKGVIRFADLCSMIWRRRWLFLPPKKSFEITLERPGHETKTFIVPNSLVLKFGTYEYWYENSDIGSGLELRVTKQDEIEFWWKCWTGCDCRILINGRTGGGDISIHHES